VHVNDDETSGNLRKAVWRIVIRRIF